MRVFTTRKIQLLFILGLFSFLGYGQDTPPSLLPDFTPPSPEAFAFTKYSSEVNEFSGKVSLSVPLYTFTAGQLKLPISLNYNSSGVRVDDLPTWTGMNWILNTGGVITRVVKNLPDEYYSRLYMTDAEIDEKGASDCAPNASVFSQFYSHPQIDTERDLFQFNFNGYSGSFYLDQNLIPTLTKNENPLKIEILGVLTAQNQFLITTPDGVKYYFGGIDATEKSSSSAHTTLVPTAFYLTKIEHPVNGTILFEYDTIAEPNFFKLNKISYGEFPYEFYYIGGCVPIKNIYFNNKVQDQKTIKKIKSLNNSEEIIFNNTLYTNQNFKRVLNSIEVKNNNILTKKIEFTYQSKNSDLNLDERFFLTKLEINKALQGFSSNKKYEEFKFEYNSPFSLPARLSNAQDMLGYYNGKTNNQSLLPDNEIINYLHCPGFANRYADYTYATRGVLQKIIYPTGGYTTFEYETNPAAKEKYTSSGTYAFRNVESSTQLYSSIPHLSTEVDMPNGPLDLDFIQNDLGLVAPIFATQKAIVNINISVLNYTNINSLNDRATFNVIDLSSNQIIATKTLIIESSHILSKSAYMEVDFNLGGHYKIEVSIPNATTNITSLYANASVIYLSGYEQTDGLGIRVKRQKEFSSSNILSDQKRYYYYPIEYVNNPIDVFSVPDKIYPSFDIVVKPVSGVSDSDSSFIYIGMYSNLTNQNMHALGGTDNDKVYKYVTTSYGGDSFEKGGVQKEFNVFENQLIKRKVPLAANDATNYPTDTNATAGGAIPTSISFALRNMRSYETDNRFSVSGNCIKERYFKNNNNNLYITKDILHQYNTLDTQEINSLVVKPLFTATGQANCNGAIVYPISVMYIGYYKIFTFNNYITSSTTKEYFSPISIINKNNIDDLDSDYDFSNIKTISSTQSYEYGTLKGLPTKITTKTSDDNKDKITENIYVTQSSTLSGLTSAYTGAYGVLQSQNNVSNPIEVKQYENANLLSTQRTLYKQDANNHILPEIIQTAKGSQDLEDRVVFEEYDSKGNPTLFSYKNGTKTKYLYNSNNQVIAKIENFTGTLDPNTIAISGDPCVFINQFANSLVTVFTYDAVTNLLVQTMDSNCRKSTYIYDALHRLQQIKDHDGNVIKELDNNYRPN